MRKKSDAEASEAPLDPDQNSGNDPRHDPEKEEKKDSEDGNAPAGGFGKHYA